MNDKIRNFLQHRYIGLLMLIFITFSFFLFSEWKLVFADTATSSVASAKDKEAQLEAELAGINQEIAGLNSTIGGLKTQGASLDRDIKLLDATINRANLNIKAKNLQITQLGDGIAQKARTIQSLSAQIDREKQSLAQLVRKTDEIDQSSMLEMLLSGKNLSDFFLDLDSFDSIRLGIKNSTEALQSAQTENTTAQKELEDKQSQEMDARAELERNKQIVQADQSQKDQLLKITKNKQKTYQSVLADRQKRAAQIRAALFALRDSGEIKFGDALDYANVVSGKTGIRPAFLLAIFQQESSFGKNQGSCYLKNSTTGSGQGANTGRTIDKVMNPTRDVPTFLKITSALGRDPYATRVSCPQEVGWGGAMGAAQFIPSTWVLFSDRITSTLGTSIADPWNPRDAFMAAGLYLTDLGARPNSYSGERDAACRYFSGKKCSQSSWVAVYGDQVMSKANVIQTTMIDPLQN